MELLYVYVNDFRKIKKKGFNLSTNFEFEYNEETTTLKISKKESLFDNFFGMNITNINAIIGDNRVGKTTFLELLSCFLINHKTFTFIVIDRKIYYNNAHWKNKINISGNAASLFSTSEYFSGNRPENFHNGPIFDLLQKNFNFVIVSNSYNQNYWFTNGWVHDLTTARLLADDYNNVKRLNLKSKVSQSLANKNGDLKRNVALLNWAEQKEITLPFGETNLEKVGLYFNSSIGRLGIKENNFEIFEWCYKRVAPFMQGVEPSYNFKTINDIELIREWMAACTIAYLVQNNFSLKRNFRPPSNNDDFFSAYKRIINQLSLSGKNRIKDKFIDFIELVSEIKANEIEGQFLWNEYMPHDFQSFFIHSFQCKISRQVVEPLIDISYETEVNLPLFYFSWGLSSGELAFLNFLSRLKDANDRISNGNSESILLILDEPTTHFHPEWERNFVEYLTKYVPIIFKNHKVQILFTTHSPLTVADLPRENVIILRNDNNNHTDSVKTFGSDVFTIYSDAFNISDSFFSAFARRKMEEYFAPIINDEPINETQMLNMRNFANMIGDPIIKNKLLSLINEYPQNGAL